MSKTVRKTLRFDYPVLRKGGAHAKPEKAKRRHMNQKIAQGDWD